MPAIDTSPEAESIQIDILRKALVWKRLLTAGEMSAAVVLLSRLGVARRNPGATAAELRSLASSAHGVARATLDADIDAIADTALEPFCFRAPVRAMLTGVDPSAERNVLPSVPIAAIREPTQHAEKARVTLIGHGASEAT